MSRTTRITHTTLDGAVIYEVSVRAKVCDNCYRSGGELQTVLLGLEAGGPDPEVPARIRYGVFGYLNDADMKREGGAAPRRQKFVGAEPDRPRRRYAGQPEREWDTTTGMLIRNPNPADATTTTEAAGQTIGDSGVINYLNKFGQMMTQNHKNYDPVSELYYAAIRYLKNKGNVPEYTNLSGTSAAKYNLAGGLPSSPAGTIPSSTGARTTRSSASAMCARTGQESRRNSVTPMSPRRRHRSYRTTLSTPTRLRRKSPSWRHHDQHAFHGP